MKRRNLHYIIKADGFTLLELLLTGVLIAVLLAVLLPVMGRLRQSAQATNCVGQLRQLYGGFAAYAQEHRGYLPRGGTNATDDSGGAGWRGTVWMKPTVNPESGFPPYCGGQEIVNRLVVCPSNRLAVSATHAYQYTPEGFPYICNYEAMTNTGVSRKPANLWRVKTTQLALLFDSGVELDWKGPGLNSGTASWERLGRRHRSGFNTLWADGRVTQMRPSELRVDNLLPQDHGE